MCAIGPAKYTFDTPPVYVNFLDHIKMRSIICQAATSVGPAQALSVDKIRRAGLQPGVELL